MRFAGLRPLSVEDLLKMSSDWRSIYLSDHAGLVTEANLNYGEDPSEEELYTSEAYFTIRSSWRYSAKLLLRYLFNWSRPSV